MKFAHYAVLTSMIATLTSGFSFFDVQFATASSPASVSNGRNTATGMIADEENRIYGGAETTIARYSYMAGLQYSTNFGIVNECGSTLIATQHVVTAGHCIVGTDPIRYVTLESKYMTGGLDGESDVEADAEHLKVVEVFVHPLFNMTARTVNDIGILKLETASIQQPAVLAAANGSEAEPETNATVLGWGGYESTNDNPFTYYSKVLRSADIEIVTNDKCDALLDSQLCAGTGNGKVPCRGDSGGPLLVNKTLVGIVSYGNCGTKPGYYTRVSYFLDFINDALDGKLSGVVSEPFNMSAASISPGTPLSRQ